MTDLNLNQYTDSEILEAFLKLDMLKCIKVMNGIAVRFEQAKVRGERMAQDSKYNDWEDFQKGLEK